MKPIYEVLPLDRIIAPNQPLRSEMAQIDIDELVASIKTVGIIEPLVVKTNGENWEVIAGHRRLIAARMAGLMMAPCLIIDVDELKAEVLKLHENSARAEISAVDWSNHLLHLKQRFQLDTAKLAELIGWSETWVKQHLAILEYPAYLKEALASGKMSFTSARELYTIKDEAKRKQYVEYAVKSGITPALAANWRREANSVTPEPFKYPDGQIQPPPPLNPNETQIVCPVCKLPVPIEEAMTITIHHHCAPED